MMVPLVLLFTLFASCGAFAPSTLLQQSSRTLAATRGPSASMHGSRSRSSCRSSCKRARGGWAGPSSRLRMAEVEETMILTEENVEACLEGCRKDLGTLFGYDPENQKVGITGQVDLVEMDGPGVVIALKGRFWHERTAVLARVTNYITQRIPECIEVNVSDPSMLSEEINPQDSLSDDDEPVPEPHNAPW